MLLDKIKIRSFTYLSLECKLNSLLLKGHEGIPKRGLDLALKLLLQLRTERFPRVLQERVQDPFGQRIYADFGTETPSLTTKKKKTEYNYK